VCKELFFVHVPCPTICVDIDSRSEILIALLVGNVLVGTRHLVFTIPKTRSTGFVDRNAIALRWLKKRDRMFLES